MTDEEYVIILKNCAFMLADGIKYLKEEHQKQFKEAYERAIEALSAKPQTAEWVTVKSADDYPNESGEYLTILQDTAFSDYQFTDITEIDCDGVFKKWNLKPQYKVIAWYKYPQYERG